VFVRVIRNAPQVAVENIEVYDQRWGIYLRDMHLNRIERWHSGMAGNGGQASVILLVDMPTSQMISVSQYLHTSYRPDCDYIDGIVEERNVGEWDHADLQGALVAYFRARRKLWNIQAVPECRVQVAPTRFRIPDVCVILGQERQEPILRKPPFICIEILSSEDRTSRVQERVNDYFAFGVPNVWIFDPRSRNAYQCTPQGMTETAVLRTENPEIVVPLDAVFDF
jgi:Uma2 family endonuclease